MPKRPAEDDGIERHKKDILAMYIGQDQSLSEVMNAMRQRPEGFNGK
jgi:hypothetical protein